MSSIYGESLKLTIFGQSHGPAVGMTLDGIPAGLPVDESALQSFLDRRAPGKSALTSPRREPDRAEFLSGTENGHTNGSPICALIHNSDIRSGDYTVFQSMPRPGHADLPMQVKYGGFQSIAGGGHQSGRLTAPLCIAGGLCMQWLAMQGVAITGKLVRIGTCQDPDGFEEEIRKARDAGNSLGGVIECTVTGLPMGLGEPMFGGMENRIAQIAFAIPGLKGIEFGSGFAGSAMYGSEHNDAWYMDEGAFRTKTNHAGGVLGGMTTGMPLVFRAAMKPTPSIAIPQKTLCLDTMQEDTLQISGRHDPCIALRAVPAVEAAAAIAIMDAILSDKGVFSWTN